MPDRLADLSDRADVACLACGAPTRIEWRCGAHAHAAPPPPACGYGERVAVCTAQDCGSTWDHDALVEILAGELDLVESDAVDARVDAAVERRLGVGT